MSDRFDRQLRQWFAGLRDADREGTPGFARTLAPRHAVHAPRRVLVRAMGVATVTAVVIVAAVIVRRDRPRPPFPSIAEWRPASDALLQIARPAGFDQIQMLGTSSLNSLVPPPSSSGAHR